MPHNILVFNRQEPQNIPVGKPRQQGGSVHFPGGDVQRQRLAPQLQRLSEAFEHHRAAIQRDIQGLDPESVIVFEVAEGVDSFITAARKAGMEWMGDWDSMMDADDDFYIDEDQTKKVPEKLYFTMSDQRALEQMLSLWQRYQDGDARFERGFGGFRKVFEQLRNVRLWNVQDRFYDTGVDTVRENALQHNTATIRFEIELWYRDNGNKRVEAQNQITRILEQFGGSVIQVSEYPEIAYHGMIAECPADGISMQFPLPQSLISQKTLKRLTLTLAWMSPVAANRKNYRVAKLDLKPSYNPLMKNTTQDSDAYASHRGTVQHEVYEDDSARTFQVNDNLVITVSCRKDDLLRSPVKFVLMATLEVAEETHYPIYQEVAIKLRNQVRVGN